MGVRGFKTGLALILLLLSSAVGAATVEFEIGGFTRQVAATPVQRLGLDWSSIQRLYDQLGTPSIWHRGADLNERGRQLSDWLSAAELEGLNPSRYHLDQLWQLTGPQSAEIAVVRELLLSDGYLRLATDLRQGNPAVRALDPFGAPRDQVFDPVATLIEALEQDDLGDMLLRLSPVRVEYERLRHALARYLAIEATGGWPAIGQGQTLRPGMRGPRVGQLRERLAREFAGSATEVEEPLLFDRDLADELRRFQSGQGLVADGVLGPATLAALNVPVTRRISQIRANLERWRWLPRDLGETYLLVNTAGFDMALHSNGRVIFSGRTINGSAQRQTPAMVSRITHLIANPPWTVPRRIAVEDLLPRQQRDAEFLSRKGIRVYRRVDGDSLELDPATIDWSLYHEENFPFILKQDAGAGNSLGRVKFYLPNSGAIYLHDTPFGGLFQRSRRALSSGCVRVEKAARLARLLINRATPEEAKRFTRAMQRGETLIAQLEEPVPVYLAYFTSWVDEAGVLQFRPDIYRRDSALLMAIDVEQRPPPPRLAGSAVRSL